MAGMSDSEVHSTASAARDAAMLADRADVQHPREVTLGSRDLAMLAFERAWWRRGGIKEEAIREEFGISAARYYQLLGVLIDTAGALREDPMLVKRLQRLRDARAVRRADLIRVTRTS